MARVLVSTVSEWRLQSKDRALGAWQGWHCSNTVSESHLGVERGGGQEDENGYLGLSLRWWAPVS